LLPLISSKTLVISTIASVTAALSNVTGKDGDCLEPTARNSNLLPVKANGEVRLRSVRSREIGGKVATFRSRTVPPTLTD